MWRGRGLMACARRMQTRYWGTPRGRCDEHSNKFFLSTKPRFNRPVGEGVASEVVGRLVAGRTTGVG
jgi:hypothetical protein